MARIRITISLDTDSTSDRAVLEFLTGLPRRTRSEIVKELLLGALEKKDAGADLKPQTPIVVSAPDVIDPEEIIAKLF